MKLAGIRCVVWFGLIAGLARLLPAVTPEGVLSTADYPSIQDAIAANPGRMLFVPAGDHATSTTIRIGEAGGGLYGPGRIVSSNGRRPILEVEHARNVRLEDLTLTRTPDQQDLCQPAVLVNDCVGVTLDGLQIIDNRTQAGVIRVQGAVDCQIVNCLIENYMSIAIDDRTQNEDYGYAFNCIDGTGLVVERSQGTLIQGCRVIENRLIPTPEIKEQYALGLIVKRGPRGKLMSEERWARPAVDNWHQGSAVIVTSPMESGFTRLLGNSIKNAAQGIDIHSDNVIISNNIVQNSFMGMKAMHGSRNVLIIGNQFSQNDLWSIGLMPGAASHAATAAGGDEPARNANVDGGSIIANNIISDFGYGSSHWIWGNQGNPILLNAGQEPDDPALRDVIVTGNIVYDTGRDGALVDGVPAVEPPRYQYAIFVAPGETSHQGALAGPVGMHFANNILHPGQRGISNIELAP